MTTKIEAPTMGESIAEATVANWSKAEGDFVEADELIAELETDKVNLEVVAPKAGKLVKIATQAGATVTPGDVMGEIDESASAQGGAEDKAGSTKAEEQPATETKAEAKEPAKEANKESRNGPAASKLMAEKGVAESDVEGTGKDGRVTKGDVLNHLSQPKVTQASAQSSSRKAGEREERVPMSRIRKTIASRLKTAQNTAAMLTTYNEVDLKAVGDLRKQYKDKFQDQYGVKLGYMSFFTKAVVEALKAQPAINAEIDGEDIVYKNYYDIGIAVSSERGLVVPVVRDADGKSFAEIEQDINDYGTRARSGGIKPDELAGATFTITNGGVFGSMMSMPILNYPQVGILGMHAIKERPVAINGEVVIRPMMYLALTYDHRVVDGKEAVSFLVKIKESLEDPGRLLLGV